MSTFAIGDTDFLLDGAPFRILSGALHYFRVHPDLWADRIHKAKLMGLNTIETYVAWNEHSPVRGAFDTTGGLDLARFLDLVKAEGMHAIVRPGPFICAEWDNGGLPAWLFENPQVGIRRFEPFYLEAVAEFFDALLPIVVPRQVDSGGPVILLQIENEYGAYGSDKRYLQALVDLTRERGITVPFTTIDQPGDLDAGGLDSIHKTASFGSRSAERLATLREHQKTGPLMCAEFWNGWFDHWGAHHHVTAADQAAADLDELLRTGASVNLYMFHGGTNFGFTNGSNDKGVYQPTTTSYDYDAPLTEAGDPGPKYWAFREVIAKYAPVPVEVPDAAVPAPEFDVSLDRAVALSSVVDSLGEWSDHIEVPTLDDIGQFRGFAQYRTELGGGGVLAFDEIRDRAQFFLDGVPLGILSRDHHERAIVIPRGGVLDVVVEDQGRVNYGERIGEKKGLIGPALLDGQPVTGWRVLPIDLARVDLAGVTGPALVDGGPIFLAGSFSITEPADLFLDMSGFTKGVVLLNGFSLGRYWSRGPGSTLYVPAPLLAEGENELVILELQATTRTAASFVSAPVLGHTEQ